jgi:hypothetical protein
VRRLGCDGPLELRVWNPTGQVQPLALTPRSWQAVRADGTPLAAPTHERHAVPPHALLTLRART